MPPTVASLILNGRNLCRLSEAGSSSMTPLSIPQAGSCIMSSQPDPHCQLRHRPEVTDLMPSSTPFYEFQSRSGYSDLELATSFVVNGHPTV